MMCHAMLRLPLSARKVGFDAQFQPALIVVAFSQHSCRHFALKLTNEIEKENF